MDTFKQVHFFKKLLPILTTGKIDKKQAERMKQCYVAMTRPTHLLCLAITENSLPEPAKWQKHKKKLEDLGWQIKTL